MNINLSFVLPITAALVGGVYAPVFAQAPTAELKVSVEKVQKLSAEGKFLEAANLLTPLAKLAEKELDFQLVFGANFFNLAGTEATGSAAQTQHLKLAEAALDEALILSSRNAFALNVRGLCRSRLGRLPEAETDLQAAADMEPGNGRYRGDLGEAQLGQSKWALAQSSLAIAESLLRVENASPRTLADVLAKRSAASLGLSRGPNAPPSEVCRALAEAICAVKLDGKNTAALLAAADAWYALGEFSRAAYNLKQAKQLDPKVSRIFTEEGAAKNAQGKIKIQESSVDEADKEEFKAAETAFRDEKYVEAAGIYAKILEKDPIKRVGAWSNRALMRRRLVGDDPKREDFYPALADRATAVLLHFVFPDSARELAEGLQDQAEDYADAEIWSGAVASGELALKAVPDDNGVKTLLGEYRVKQSRSLVAGLPKAFAAAILALDGLLQREPANLEYLKARADRLSDAKNPRALADFGAALVLSPEPENYVRRGDYYLAQGKLDEALADFEGAILLNYSQVDYRLARAGVKRRKGDAAGAKKDYDDCRKLDSTIPAVSADLSDADAADKMRKDASRLSDRRFEELRNSRVTLTEDYVKKADDLLKNKQVAAALVQCTKAIAQSSGYAPAYALRGQILLAIQRPDLAVLNFNKQVILEPKSAQALLNRGNALATLGRYADAINDYDLALALDPKLTEAGNNRALARKKLPGK